MSQQANIAATQRLGEAVNSGNLDVLHEVFAPNVIDRDPGSDQLPGPEGFIQFFTGFRAAFPDLSIGVEQMVADDDNIAIAYTITGTHQGDFLGIPATGRPIKARGVQIARFEHGQIVERWGSSDQLGILQQLGVNPIAAT
ncbi:MAG: ester cyclase [Tildeniella nuda ZEHNDER 1965/U140]|jgi:steroid delta-isomerase-like uncharacterized protein|nr:ester cyclase [Tildeniella nuda ZEHNDER 1965/U140]